MKEFSVLAIDLAKEVFQLHATDKGGKVMMKKKMRRAELLAFVANIPPCIIAMEACGGSHYWGRRFLEMGHEVRLISPQFVKPFVKSSKNDANDAEAIVEAALRPSMRFVPVKRKEQQDIQNFHRIRERLIRSRTALSNECRGLLHEYGIVIPKSISKLMKLLPEILENETELLTPLSMKVFRSLIDELKLLDERIEQYDKEINEIFKASHEAQRIQKIPGVGQITATAIIAAIGDPRSFKNGRQFSAWLGLVPRQNSSGGKTVLLGITKRGDSYIRKLLILGAKSALYRAPLKEDSRSKWISNKVTTKGNNKTAVALANKNARVIWALLAKKEEYKMAA